MSQETFETVLAVIRETSADMGPIAVKLAAVVDGLQDEGHKPQAIALALVEVGACIALLTECPEDIWTKVGFAVTRSAYRNREAAQEILGGKYEKVAGEA